MNLRGADPSYRNNLYIITYMINLKKNSLKICGGSTPPDLSTSNSGGLQPPPPPPPWRP